MKIKLDDSNRQRIEGFLPSFRSAIQALSESNDRLEGIATRDQKNSEQLASLTALAGLPTDKQLLDLVVCRERERVHSELREKQERILQDQKHSVVSQVNYGANLFRDVASAQLFEAAETELKNSLPASVLSDQHLTFRLLSESASKRNVGRFLNSFSATPRDDAGVVIEESERLGQLLDNLLNGREIAVPGAEQGAAVTSA